MLTLLCEQKFINLELKINHQKCFRSMIHSQTKIPECLFYSIEKTDVFILILWELRWIIERSVTLTKLNLNHHTRSLYPFLFLSSLCLSQCDMTQTEIAG